MTTQIHLPEPVEPALKPPLALLVGKKMRRRETKDGRRPRKISVQFLVSLQVGDQLQKSPNTHTHTHTPQTAKGAEQEGREKREETPPDSQTMTGEIRLFDIFFFNYYLFYIGYQIIERLLHFCVYISRLLI